MWIWHENRILCIYFTGFNQCQYCVALAVATAAANSIHHKSNSINYFAMWLQHCTVRVSVWIMKCVASFQCKNDAYANYFVFSASTSGFLGKVHVVKSSQVNTPYTQHTLYIHSTSSISQLLLCFFPFFSFSPPPSSTSALILIVVHTLSVWSKCVHTKSVEVLSHFCTVSRKNGHECVACDR